MVHPKQSPENGDRSPIREDAALERIGRRLTRWFGEPPTGQTWRGDDAAVLLVPAVGSASTVLFTTDAVVNGIHFDLGVVSIADVGWKSLSVAVSDIAAMGGSPTHAVVTLCAPAGTDVEFLAEGLGSAAHHWGCPVVGGDLVSSRELVVSVAVTGVLQGAGPAVLRSGARPGDALFVTGPLGASAAGLRILRDPESGARLSEQTRHALEGAYRRPEARVAEGRAARQGGATAMMDVSDGLGLDAHRLAQASSVGFVLDEPPIAPGATRAEALGGGEDYELLIAAPDEASLTARFREAGLRAPIMIGRCSQDPTERRLGDEEIAPTGYQHRL